MFIALTGTIGSGKNTVAEYLVEKHGFVFASGSAAIAEEVKKRNLSVTRENMRAVANELRNGNSTRLIDATIQTVSQSDKSLIGFLRTENEVKRLREIKPDAILVAIDAPVQVRYERTLKRGELKDATTFEGFVASEGIEMYSENSDMQNMGYCLSQADFTIINDSSLEALYKKIKDILQK